MTPPSQSPREFILFVDTNAYWTNDEKIDRIDLLPSSFQEQWRRISSKDDVTLIIPEVSLLELVYQKQRTIFQAYKDARTKLRAIQNSLDLEIPEIPVIDSQTIESSIEKNLRSQINEIPHCQLALIPYKFLATNIESIVDGSLRHYPPFERGRSEKGFRDCLILETVRLYQSQHIHVDVAFITNDGRLEEAVQNRFKSAANFGFFKDLNAYENFLNVARSRYQPEFLHSVASIARDIFPLDVWSGSGIEAHVISKYGLERGRYTFESGETRNRLAELAAKPVPSTSGLFGLGSLGTPRKCSGVIQHEFRGTTLVSVVGENEFHWDTIVIFTIPYIREGTLLVPNDEVVSRILVLSVEWKATVSESKAFSGIGFLRDTELLDIYRHPEEAAKLYQKIGTPPE